MKRLAIIVCIVVGMAPVASLEAGVCVGTRACIKTICEYLSPATRCIEVESKGYGAGLVTDLDDGTKKIEWAGTFFRGNHILMGPILIDLDEERTSKGIVRPIRANSGSFFPASTMIEFYFTVRVPNRGWVLKNRDPVRVSSQEIQAIPPRGAVFVLVQPVDFFRAQEMNDPGAKPVILLKKATILFDPPERLLAFPVWLQILFAFVAVPLVLFFTRVRSTARLLSSGTRADWRLLRRSAILPMLALFLLLVGILWTYRTISAVQLFAAVLAAVVMTLSLYLFRWASRQAA